MKSKSWLLSFWLPVTLALCLTGCPNAAPPEIKAPAEGEKSAEDKAAAEKHAKEHADGKHDHDHPKPIPFRKDAKDLSGKWALVVVERDPNGPSFEFTLGILEMQADKPENFAKLIARDKVAEALEVTDSKLQDDRFQLSFKDSATTIELQGKLKEGVVYGVFRHHNDVLTPCYLVPTTADSLKGYQTRRSVPSTERFLKAAQAKNLRSLLQFSAANKQDPLALDVFQALVGIMSQQPNQRLNEAESLQLFKDYTDAAATWGPWLVSRANLTIASAQIEGRWLVTEAPRHITLAEENAGEMLPLIKIQLKGMRELAAVVIALEDTWSDSAVTRESALKSFQSVYEQQPQHPLVLLGLAEAHERENRPDEAIKYYIDLVALPQLEGAAIQERERRSKGSPTPRQSLAALWKAKHGSTDQLDSALQKQYDAVLHELFAKAHAESPVPEDAANSQRVAMIEIFTGTQCPPCVGPDLAVGGMLQTFPRDKVVALQYHMHIPRPDPLANQDAELRYEFYVPKSQAPSTPLLILDGQPMTAGGYMMQARSIYSALRDYTIKELQKPTEISLKLAAEVQGESVVIRASAEKLPEEKLDSLRLRLALVEDEIRFPAPNGLQAHEMVVRALPGGKKGFKKPFTAEASINLTELRQQLEEELAEREKRDHFRFPEKPLALRKLSVVAWVQDDETKQILQAIYAPVSGGVKPAEGTTPAAPEAK